MEKVQTIYEYLKDYSQEDVDNAVFSLGLEDLLVIKSRYGNDLANPQTQEDWDKAKRDRFYGSIIPKLKRVLSKSAVKIVKDENVTLVKDEAPVTKMTSGIRFYGDDDYDTITSLIREGKTNKEICDILNISKNRLYEELLKMQNMGIKQNRRYYSDGSIKYSNVYSIRGLKENTQMQAERTIITDPSENKMKFLLLSDLHFGNEQERLDLIDRAFNYCKKNGINIILSTGDFIDGTRTLGKQNIESVYKQIEHFLKDYPSDDSILTFGVGGDHDYTALRSGNIDLIEACDNFRHDIIIGGYNNAYVNVKNDCIHLYHHMDNGKIIYNNSPIVLHGHSHQYSTFNYKNFTNISLPSITDINQPIPSFLELDVEFTNGVITSFVVKHIYPSEQDVLIGENSYEIADTRDLSSPVIKNVEPYKEAVKVKTK